MLKTELALTGFWKSPANVSKLAGEIQNYLADFGGLAFANRKLITSEILSWARDERVSSSIIYSED